LCVVLSPLAPSRRRVCVSRPGRRLRATIDRIDEFGFAAGRTRVLGGARVVVRGGFVSLRVPADELGVTLGHVVQWRTYVYWRDEQGCALVPDPGSCTQTLPAAGVWTLATQAAQTPDFARHHRLRLLATGDSMIQTVDGYLARGLASHGGASVRSDARIGSGISKPQELDWVRKARGQAADVKPDVTVMFIGANDGSPLGSARCCGRAWVDAYAARVEAMMRSYLRGGRSYVYWLTLPAPRPATFARVFPRVNEAIRQAARRVGGGARVVDLVPVFTPGGHFRQTITFHGRTIDARQPDGIHLSLAGAAVAAALVIDRLRADHALP
jgi:hypothetical protein